MLADDGIAVVGMACRFPAAPHLQAFWELLCEGRHGVSDLSTRNDWNAQRVRGLGHAALLDDIAGFDAPFFRISPREAETMDPQQRLVLELSWHALEDAGIVPSRLRGRPTGVYLGISGSGYAMQSAALVGDRDPTQLTGSLCSIAANRLSYYLGVHGPSLAVDTACSSSLVAIHLACESLVRGESDIALAGGVSLILDDFISSTLTEAGVLSTDGRCKTFDERADGYVRGEGAAMLVLRPRSEAERAGDRIYAVIRGSAVNQDGASNGLTAPSREAQEEVLASAYARAGVVPVEVDYVEAHGTGTLLGDPIEAKALGLTLGRGREPDRPCRLGSAKTNIGHLEAAAGVAGVVKCCLMLHHEQFVPSLNFETANPYIQFERLKLSVQTRSEPWKEKRGARVAGVSSFGIGGTNSHLVLESAPRGEQPRPARAPVAVLPLSAGSPAALAQLASHYRARLETVSDGDLPAFCHAVATQREALAWRSGLVAQSVREMRQALAPSSAAAAPAVREEPRIAFLFTGQGSQYASMGAGLFRSEPVFRRAVESCTSVLDGELERPLLDVIFGDDPATIHETIYAQPAIFTLEYALAQVWKVWGIEPSAVLGHSVGELVAGCVAGVLGLEEALRLVTLRGSVMQGSSPSGAMLAARMAEQDALALLRDLGEQIDLAAVNGPFQTVFSGPSEPLERIAERLREDGVSCRRLPVTRAFHSALLDPLLPELARGARRLRFETPSLPFFSNVTGSRASAEVADPEYWVKQARSTVRFGDCLEALRAEGVDAILEIGASPILTPLARTALGADVRAVASLRPGASDAHQMAASLAGLFEAGATPNWGRFYGSPARRHVALPSYPFQHQPYWLKGDSAALRQLEAPAANSALESDSELSSSDAETLVVSRLAVMTGHPATYIQIGSELDSLGISSIGLVELSSTLAGDLPSLAADEPAWADVRTVADVVALVEPHLHSALAPAAAPSTPDFSSSSVEVYIAMPATGLRTDPRHRTIDSVESDGSRVRARILVDESHPFFFDHPYDHVPGVLFVDAAQQLTEWLATALGGDPLRRQLYVDDFSMRFERWGDPAKPLWIDSHRLTRTDGAWHLTGSISGEEECARFTCRFRAASLPPSEGQTPTASPATADLVHKTHPENILVSEPRRAEDGVVAIGLQPPPGHALRSAPAEHATLTQLAEWARQFSTARAHALEEEPFEERFILLSVRLTLAAPIGTAEPMTLWAPLTQSIDVGSMRLGNAKVELRRRDHRVGQIRLSGAATDARQYELARWGEDA
jgi:acyl transferase domain-containing protein/3-hydroxymyristoyl/3-hydroxydecanoyl-(acyl carrier protein) dehydratase